MTEISQDEMVYAVIYKYTNKLNGKTYVGQTINEDQRMKDHLKAARLESNSQHHTPFHRALKKYGLENFDYEVIFRIHCPKEVAKDILNPLEEKYVKEYSAFIKDGGYNLTKGGDGVKGREIPIEQRKRQSEALKGRFAGEKNPMYGTHWNENQKKCCKPIVQLSLDGNLVAEYESIASATRALNLSSNGNISKCLKGTRKTVYGFKWKYKNDGE